jgi:hypothetical protein
MRVEIRWVEEVHYRTVVEVDDESFAQFSDETSEDAMLDYLNANEEEWFEQCDTDVDFTGVEKREVLEAKID